MKQTLVRAHQKSDLSRTADDGRYLRAAGAANGGWLSLVRVQRGASALLVRTTTLQRSLTALC